MSRKRRIFDITMPDEQPAAPPAHTPNEAPASIRRGPMAAAISENASSLRERAEAEARIRAENDALAHEFVRLKKEGLVTARIPLDAIRTDKLVRDRAPGEDDELAELVTSIRDTGLSNPIRVEEAGEGKYELIQGFRRLSAYRRLHQDTGDSEWGEIPAGILPRGEALGQSYRRMVDENLIRKDLSFAEMAETARAYAADPATTAQDTDSAVTELFRSAGYQKRSYIRAFARLLDHLGKSLEHPQALPRNLGLAVLKRLEDHPETATALRARLAAETERTAEEELGVLRAYAEAFDNETPSDGNRRGQGAPRSRKARTTFEILHRRGKARCIAQQGRLEIRVDRDFAEIDRAQLEAAISKFLDDAS